MAYFDFLIQLLKIPWTGKVIHQNVWGQHQVTESNAEPWLQMPSPPRQCTRTRRRRRLCHYPYHYVIISGNRCFYSKYCNDLLQWNSPNRMWCLKYPYLPVTTLYGPLDWCLCKRLGRADAVLMYMTHDRYGSHNNPVASTLVWRPVVKNSFLQRLKNLKTIVSTPPKVISMRKSWEVKAICVI